MPPSFMFKYSIRDIVWLTLLTCVSLGWFVGIRAAHRRIAGLITELERIKDTEQYRKLQQFDKMEFELVKAKEKIKRFETEQELGICPRQTDKRFRGAAIESTTRQSTIATYIQNLENELKEMRLNSKRLP